MKRKTPFDKVQAEEFYIRERVHKTGKWKGRLASGDRSKRREESRKKGERKKRTARIGIIVYKTSL